MLTYTVELHSLGLLRSKFTVPASPSTLIGDYHNGKPFEPCLPAISNKIPFRFRKAALRATLWHDGVVFSIPLFSLRGKPLATIFASRNF